MSTPRIKESEIKGFKKLQKEQGGIIPSKLKLGTTVLVETNEFVYGLKKIESKKYLLDTGSPVCRPHKNCIDICSHFPKLKCNMPDWIGKDMRLILKFDDGGSVMIGTVKGVTVKTNKFQYNLWEDQ